MPQVALLLGFALTGSAILLMAGLQNRKNGYRRERSSFFEEVAVAAAEAEITIALPNLIESMVTPPARSEDAAAEDSERQANAQFTGDLAMLARSLEAVGGKSVRPAPVSGESRHPAGAPAERALHYREF